MQPEKQKRSTQKTILIILGIIFALCFICFVGLMIFGFINASSPTFQATSTARAKITQTFAALPTNTPLPSATPLPPTNTLTPEPTQTIEVTATPTHIIVKSIKILIDNVGLSEKEAEAAFEIIKSVGFEEIYKLTLFRKTENIVAYQASLGYTSDYYIFFTTDNIVYSITGNDIEFYNSSKGGVLDSILNYTLSSEQQSIYQIATEKVVTSILKAPSTAKFPGWLEQDQWKFGRTKDIVTVSSWVDSQNSFGAMIRGTFIAQYDFSSNDLICLIFDDAVVYGSCRK